MDNFHLVQMDVTDESSIASALEWLQHKEAQLDVLINNAGLGMAGPLENTSAEEVREIFETNVFGVLNVCRQAIDLLRRSDSPYLINITSIAGRVALPFRGIYSSSKFAVEGLTESLSMELRPFGIRVSIIEPGDFRTNINANRRVAKHVDHTLYNGTFDQTLEQINAHVQSAQDPILIARQVERILNTSKPKLRYIVATRVQRLSIQLKRLLPGRKFERMLMGHYDLD